MEGTGSYKDESVLTNVAISTYYLPHLSFSRNSFLRAEGHFQLSGLGFSSCPWIKVVMVWNRVGFLWFFWQKVPIVTTGTSHCRWWAITWKHAGHYHMDAFITRLIGLCTSLQVRGFGIAVVKQQFEDLSRIHIAKRFILKENTVMDVIHWRFPLTH